MFKKLFHDDIAERIKELKKKRDAVILAHNYQLPEVQDIADFRGDSLELSRQAAKTSAKVIVFCGVHFMAETASILCPDKKVIMPDIQAGCPMANMISAEDLRRLKREHNKAPVVGYVNTSAQVKAELDYCCTSTNAVAVVNALRDEKDIIFVPDKYLADYVSKKTGRTQGRGLASDRPQGHGLDSYGQSHSQSHRKLISWNGYCPTHVKILPEDIKREKRFHPFAMVMAHPECLPSVVAMADAVLSTSGMANFARGDQAKEFIVATEVGLIYRLKQDNPKKEFYAASEAAVCPNMKRTTQEKILWALEELKTEVRVSEDIRLRAKKAIDRMLEIS